MTQDAASIKQIAGEMDKLTGLSEINWPKTITLGVAKVNVKRNLLTEIEPCILFEGSRYPLCIQVYGIREEGRIEGMRCESEGEEVDRILGERLLEAIANSILSGNHD